MTEPHVPSELEEESPLSRLRALASASFRPWASATHLRPAKPELIRAGTAGGLPFDVFTTDVVSGCLPPSQICFGNCFAAKSAYEAGIDFGHRVPNVLDEAVFADDLSRLPAAQGYVCNGWNSDPSWAWETVVRMTRLVHAAGKHPVLITKMFRLPSDEQWRALVATDTEVRICISAFDSDQQVNHRIGAMERYRAEGGLCVAIVMTTVFKDEALRRRQDGLVERLEAIDLPASENSLRVVPSTPVALAVDLDVCREVPKSPGEVWAGRLYPDRVTVPARFCTPFTYRGGLSPYASKNPRAMLDALNAEPIPTQAQVLASSGLPKPRSAGIPRAYTSLRA